MLLGRHRGLPDTVDRAVQLPRDLTLMIHGKLQLEKKSKQKDKIVDLKDLSSSNEISSEKKSKIVTFSDQDSKNHSEGMEKGDIPLFNLDD